MKTNFCLIHQYLPIPLDKKSVTGKHFDFCKYLNNSGVDVTIITADNSHVFKRSVKVKGFYKTVRISGIKVKFIKTILHNNPRGFVRILNWFIFSFWAWYFITVKHYKNIFVSVLPQTNILSIYFSITSRLRSKIFLEIRDIWPLSGKYLMGLNENSIVYILLRQIEKIGYKISDIIVSPLPKFKDYLIKEIKMFDNKFLNFPNGISKEAMKISNENVVNTFKSSKKNKTLKFGYFGGLGVSNKVENIIRILMKLNFNFIVDIYGDGSEKNKLLKISDSRINFHNPISRFDAISVMKKYDYLCMAQPDADVYKYGIASLKLVDYLVSNIPIIQFCKKKYEFIESHGLGYFLDTDSEEQQNSNLKIIFNRNKNKNRSSIINNQTKYLMDNLILDNYFKNFYKILN